jgi:hypothetical protein
MKKEPYDKIIVDAAKLGTKVYKRVVITGRQYLKTSGLPEKDHLAWSICFFIALAKHFASTAIVSGAITTGAKLDIILAEFNQALQLLVEETYVETKKQLRKKLAGKENPESDRKDGHT